MASRNFKRLQALQSEIKHLHAKVTVAGSGAPTLVTANGASLGIASITRDTAGVYDLVLEDEFVALVDFNVVQVVAAVQDLQFQVEDVDMDTKTIKFRCHTAAVETDPASGSELLIKLELKNSTVK